MTINISKFEINEMGVVKKALVTVEPCIRRLYKTLNHVWNYG